MSATCTTQTRRVLPQKTKRIEEWAKWQPRRVARFWTEGRIVENHSLPHCLNTPAPHTITHTERSHPQDCVKPDCVSCQNRANRVAERHVPRASAQNTRSSSTHARARTHTDLRSTWASKGGRWVDARPCNWATWRRSERQSDNPRQRRRQDTSECPHPDAWQRWSQCQVRPAPPPSPPPPRPLESPLLRGAVLSYASCHVRPPPVAPLPGSSCSHTCVKVRVSRSRSVQKWDGPSSSVLPPSLPPSFLSVVLPPQQAAALSLTTLCAPTALAFFPLLIGESICSLKTQCSVFNLKIPLSSRHARGRSVPGDAAGPRDSRCAKSGRTESGSQKVLVMRNYPTANFRDHFCFFQKI